MSPTRGAQGDPGNAVRARWRERPDHDRELRPSYQIAFSADMVRQGPQIEHIEIAAEKNRSA